MLCTESSSGKYQSQLIDLNLVGILFDLKQQIGEEAWLESYDEMTSMYCYVIS